MKKKNNITVLVLLILYSAVTGAGAQITDTVSLNTIDVMGSRASIFTGGITTILADSAKYNPFQNQSVSELLSANSSVFIKTYGSGGSATITSRGTEARHNAVLWNGFNINSSSLGLTDLSMIPSCLTDKITLMHGGSSPVNGNSALGSSIVFENSIPTFNSGNATTIIAEGGSFGNAHSSLSTKLSNRILESKTVLFFDAAKNDFNYINYTHRDKPEVRQQHAAYSNYGFVQDFQFRITKHQFLSAGIWYQDTQRELPSLMTSPGSNAHQRDSSWRMYAGYKMVLKKSVLSVKGAYFREFQYYDDEKYRFHTRYVVNNYFAEAEWRLFLHEKVIVNSGVAYNQGRASFKEYSGTRSRLTYALFSDIRYQVTTKWRISLNMRQEFSTIASPPFSPSVILEGPLYKNQITFLAKAGHNYSLPSMNDLYWVPGGNVELKPENAWGEEIALLFFRNHQKLPALTVTAYNTVVDNWIKWQPGAGGIYSPDNLRQVHSRGIETSLAYKKLLRSWAISTSIQYAWCRSTVSKVAHVAESATSGKQLMYVPEHILNANFTVAWKSFSVFISNTYTGERYTTSDNTAKLNGYFITNLSIEKNFKNNRWPLSLYIKVMNLTNTTYQVLAYRPTPGRWFSAGLKINFQLPLHTTKPSS